VWAYTPAWTHVCSSTLWTSRVSSMFQEVPPPHSQPLLIAMWSMGSKGGRQRSKTRLGRHLAKVMMWHRLVPGKLCHSTASGLSGPLCAQAEAHGPCVQTCMHLKHSTQVKGKLGMDVPRVWGKGLDHEPQRDLVIRTSFWGECLRRCSFLA
jgi:hypothetical protein